MAYKILCVIGTRPEALKMAPIIAQLKTIPEFTVITLVTGQHQELLYQALDLFKIAIDRDLAVMMDNQSLSMLTSNLLQKMEIYFNEISPRLVIAQGDTTTTYVAALVSFYQKIPFAHIEAGLRTYNFHAPYPEEFYRQSISKLASLHFSPTAQSKANLLKEGIDADSIFVTGNTIIDTLMLFSENLTIPSPAKKMILITCHRRENFGKPLQNICEAIKILALKHSAIEFVFLLHPNPNLTVCVDSALSKINNIKLMAALDYAACVKLLHACSFVLTDSGGLQEECPALHKPVLILREQTERVEAVECGAAKLIGVETDHIVQKVECLINDPVLYGQMVSAGSPYGDGRAAEYITKHIVSYYQKQQLIINSLLESSLLC